HETDQGIDHVIDVAKRSRLRAVTVDGHRSRLEGLHDQVRDHPPVVRMHARAVGIEYPGDLDRDLVLPVIVEEERLRAALCLVIAGAQPDRIDAAPVVFGLWMHLGIAVDLAGRGLKDARLDPLGQPEHVYRSMYACLGRLYRIALVVDGRRGT